MMALVEIVRRSPSATRPSPRPRRSPRPAARTPVEVKDQAGFIVNALLFPYLNNAVRMLENGTASRDDIDAAMKGGCNFPMGPLALLDLVGLDTSLAILDALYDEFRDPNYAAAPLLRRMVAPGTWAGSPARASTTTPRGRGLRKPAAGSGALTTDPAARIGGVRPHASLRRCRRTRRVRSQRRPRAVVSGRWLADAVVDIAPRLPVRDADEAVEPPRRADRRRAGRRAGPSAGRVSGGHRRHDRRHHRRSGADRRRADPGPVRAGGRDGTGGRRPRSSWSAELHDVAGRRLPGGPRQRQARRCVAWMSGRAVPPNRVVADGRGATCSGAPAASSSERPAPALHPQPVHLGADADRCGRGRLPQPRATLDIGGRLATDLGLDGRRGQGGTAPVAPSVGDARRAAAHAVGVPARRRRPTSDGVVGVGADLEPGTMLAAYRRGLFPMPVGRRGTLGWWSPDPRAVIPLDGLRVSRSLRRSVRRYEIRVDTAFDEVIDACADPPARTGGSAPRSAPPTAAARAGLGPLASRPGADDGELAGGLYGVAIGGLFAGESMFHRRTDASKVALVGPGRAAATVEAGRRAGCSTSSG